MATATASAKAPKHTRVVVLKLPSRLLEDFPSTVSVNPLKSSPKDSPSVPPMLSHDAESSSAQDPSENNATPVPDADGENGGAINATDGRRKSGGPRGIKRAVPALDADGNPRPRAKPGPKRRKRDDETAEETIKGPWTGPTPIAGVKLGPKANQGAINAGLRALDRSGKPCRRWQRKGYELKSFTGVTWLMPQWSTPKLKDSPDTNGGTNDATPLNGRKTEHASSVVESSSSTGGGDVNGNGNITHDEIPSSPAIENSPAPVVAVA